LEREIGGLGGKLGAGEKRERREQGGKLETRDKGKRGTRERGTGARGIRLGEKREEGAPLKLLSTPPSGAALSKASPCNPP
jgi:hypothetical protein